MQWGEEAPTGSDWTVSQHETDPRAHENLDGWAGQLLAC